jgi:hypothetical protein
MSLVPVLVILAALVVVGFVFKDKILAFAKSKLGKPNLGTSLPNPVSPSATNVAPDHTVLPHLVAPSTRAFIREDQTPAKAPQAVDRTGFVLKNSGFPKVNEVGTDWVEFTILATLPNQMIQASCQNAVWLEEDVNGISVRRQASNPTALNLKLPKGEHRYRVKVDRPGTLVVKMGEH